MNIEDYNRLERIFNLESGNGTSINDIADAIKRVLIVEYVSGRKVDDPLDILEYFII